MAELTDAADLSPLRILLLLQDYGHAHAAQYRLPSDEGNQALGDAARAIYAYTDAREAAARADERAKVAEEIAKAIEVKQGRRCPQCQGKAGSTKPNGYFVDKRCGAGHTWTVHEHWHAHDWAAIARQHSVKAEETA